jgi:Rps23 Pro-64 3,4-dihydroxylase Tpa1-like proline 4-hydroxylase
MDNQEILNDRNFTNYPFPHFSTNRVFSDELAQNLLNWLKSCDHWQFTKTSFYTQYEFSLLEMVLPEQLTSLSHPEFVNKMTLAFKSIFNIEKLELVGITAHKLIDGYKMGVHNDFIGKEESHRLVVQLNEGWSENNGGYLMLFNSNDPNDVASLILPIHNSGIGFEISSQSYHAVSTVYDFERYTLVYTFSTGDN